MTMSLEPLVFRRVPRVFVMPDVPRRFEIIDTTGVEILETDEVDPSLRRAEASSDAPVPFASTLPHI